MGYFPQGDNGDFGPGPGWPGSPMNGVDVASHLGDAVQTKSSKISEDGYLAMIILTALGILWLLGGVVFKSAKM